MGHETLSSIDDVDFEKSTEKKFGKTVVELYNTERSLDEIEDDKAYHSDHEEKYEEDELVYRPKDFSRDDGAIEDDLAYRQSENAYTDYNLPDRTPEQRERAKQILSQVHSQILSEHRQNLTDTEISLMSENTDIYDFINYPEVKKIFTYSLVNKVNEAAKKDFYEDEDDLFEIARIFEENEVTSDLLEEAIKGGEELNTGGVAKIGDIIARDHSKSNSAVAQGLTRAEKIGYKLFDWNGADQIMLRGPEFQETLNIERGISPSETDILYDHLIFYLRRTNHNDRISDLLTPSDNNDFAKLWQEDGNTIRNIFNRTPVGMDRFEMMGDDGSLTEKFSQSLIDNFSVNNANDNEFISRHLELFSSEELKDKLFKQIFNPAEEFKPDNMGETRDCALREFFRLAGSKSYDDNIATAWFASFISTHTAIGGDYNLFFSIGGPEDISAIAKVAPIVANNEFDGMFSYKTIDEKEKSWAQADLGLIENSMVLWQLNHPEEFELLPDFLDIDGSEEVDYAKKFPNFAEAVRMFIFHKDDIAETNPQKDEMVNLLTNSIRHRDPYANEYYHFLKPYTDDPESDYNYYRHFTPEAMKQVPAVLTALLTTNIEELARNYDIIAERALTYSPENAGQIVKNLESIYSRKDIPKFAKLYYSADMLYKDSLDSEEYGVPPFLRWAKSEESEMGDSAREVLMTDLLKNSMRSNNNSLRAYLKSCISSREDPDTSPFDTKHIEEVDIDEGDYIEEFTDNKKFRRRFFGYANRLGYNNPEQMLEAMDRLRDEKNSLHKDRVIYDENGKARYGHSFMAGDLIKGINSNYLHLAIRDGFNCPEMAGIGINKDFTHWDADFGSVRPEDDTSSIDYKISGSMADYYGDGIYAIVHRDGLESYDSSDGNVGSYDYAPYEIYHRDHDSNFRGIRTGIGSEDIDAYVVNSDNNSRRKALRLGYEMAKNGIYAPIIDRETEEVVFTPDDFEKLRNRMGGMNSRYETLPSEYDVATDLSLPDSLANESGLKYSELVTGYFDRTLEGARFEGGVKGQLCSRLQFDRSFPKEIRDAFTGIILSKLHDDHSKDPIEIITTGSSARGTGLPNNIDIDVVIRLDRGIFDNYKNEILEALTTRNKWYYNGEKSAIDGGILTNRGIRKGLVDILVSSDHRPTQVEVDISPVVTTNQRTFFSEEAAKERLHSSRRSGDTARIAANIIMAKALLKDAHAYKTDRSPEHDGGLGGLGVENWILQSGGSLRQACEEFLAAADDGQGGYVPFDDFSSRYAIFDMGENHFGNNYESPYDNFVEQNMNENGYRRMCNVCKNTLQQINNS